VEQAGEEVGLGEGGGEPGWEGGLGDCDAWGLLESGVGFCWGRERLWEQGLLEWMMVLVSGAYHNSKRARCG
jgi:hypothetical protein